MIELYIPKIDDLWFRQQMMNDEETMLYNCAWGGTIPFPKEEWTEWYDYWIVNADGERFYRYLIEIETNEFVGEVAYHYDDVRKINVADIIVYAKYRGKGYGTTGLMMLCKAAKNQGVDVLFDDIAIDNSSVYLFEKCGFTEEYRTSEYIMMKKVL